ncbi:hypothetical protein R6Y90_15430 [Alteromonas macleodii]|uniref:hypothetical protein n=1 Tax=Alteromonas macleodii TaxID=28108 RepID=UPI0029813386|nr:hypothetical protein [Alteromonas macleodii]MDW5286355.1 hypothetical protein [Alteromonas macleodii]
MKIIQYSLITVGLLSGCQSTSLVPYDSDAAYQEVANASVPITLINDDDRVCAMGAIFYLMQDYMPIWQKEVFGGGIIKRDVYYSLDGMGFSGKNAYYKYGFHIDENSNLVIKNQSKKENDRSPNPSPKDAYCMLCTDGGFTDFALMTHQYVGAELNKIFEKEKCSNYVNNASQYYQKTPRKESRTEIRVPDYKEN